MSHQRLSDAELRRLIASGTTTRPEQLKVLYNDGKRALVKHPGGHDGRRALGSSWVSSWVDLYDLTNPKKAVGFSSGKEVWNCSRLHDGPLTMKRLQALVEKLGLLPEGICLSE